MTKRLNKYAVLFGFLSVFLSTQACHAAITSSNTNIANNLVTTPVQGEVRSWPRVFQANGIKTEIYQPQIDDWKETILKTHMAIAVTFPGEKDPIYGVLYVDADMLVDRSTRSIRLSRVERFGVKFPSAPEREADFVGKMQSTLINDIGVISLDRIETALSITQAERRGKSLPVKNDPPHIIFSRQPALLVYIDGDPRWVKVGDTPLEKALNTRVLLLRDAAHRYYLHFLDGYLTADNLTGPWRVAKGSPAGVAIAEQQAKDTQQTDLLVGQPGKSDGKLPSLKNLPGGNPPQIFIATAPTELLVSNGEPNYVSLEGTNLLYVDNTTGNLFKSMQDQQNYVLLSGRWFRAASLDGPWVYISAKELPADFARIPDNSPKENAKASVPGTVQAREAVIASEIPQMARVDREKTRFTPAVDGAPQLRSIEGTNLVYVFNSPDPIIQYDGATWYALHNGVWFTGMGISDPWSVATTLPAEIYAIPVSSPLHYVVYVKIYSVTPTIVTVGYTSGYYGTIITSDDVVVYGTGYVYTPWVGTYWYGAPVSYGSGADISWTPWGGWAFGFAFGWALGYAAYADFGWWYPPAPWWGPYWGGAYYNRYGGVTAWGPGGWAGTTGNIYHRWGNAQSVGRGFAGYDAFTGNQFAGRYGAAYNSRTGAMTVGRQGAVENVYTGNYAAGGRGARFNPTTGIASSGGRVTVGNEATGRSATVSHIDAYSARTGQSVDAGSIRGSQGNSIGHINNNIYATKDGQLYRYTPNSDNHWQSMVQGQSARSSIGGGQERSFDNLPQEHLNSLNRDFESRQLGETRAQSFSNHGSQFSRGGSGGFGGGRGFGGGGFRGGGFHGFRR